MAAVVATALPLQADSISAVQTFTSEMGSWNVITSGAFSTNNHVHGTVGAGGSAKLYGNAEINSHGKTNAEALRVYGNLSLNGSNNKVLAGGATVVKNATINSKLELKPGKPNPNQATILDKNNGSSLTFNGNGGKPELATLAKADDFFSSRDAKLQVANTQLLNASGALGATIIDSDTINFNALTSGVNVFNWNVSQLTNIAEVGFKFVTDSYIVINILGNSPSSVWDAKFNILGGSEFLASHVLWNIGVATVKLSGSELLGSILAPDSKITSHKQLNGAIYAATLDQYGQEIHYTPPTKVEKVPENSSWVVTLLAGMSVVLVVLARRHLPQAAR